MLTFISILLIILLLTFIYSRYLPVFGVKAQVLQDNQESDVRIVDVRDYNEKVDQGHHRLHIPIAYLHRFYHEIDGKSVHVIASSKIEKNMSIRFLRRKGYKVSGYTLCNEC